jgi:hypothetical protein
MTKLLAVNVEEKKQKERLAERCDTADGEIHAVKFSIASRMSSEKQVPREPCWNILHTGLGKSPVSASRSFAIPKA